jgi:hypothetical protein
VRVDALRVVRVVTLPPLVRNKYGDLVTCRGVKLLQQFLCLRLIRARDVALRLEFFEAHHKQGVSRGKSSVVGSSAIWSMLAPPLSLFPRGPGFAAAASCLSSCFLAFFLLQVGGALLHCANRSDIAEGHGHLQRLKFDFERVCCALKSRFRAGDKAWPTNRRWRS